MSVFEVLNAVNVNGHTEKKNGLTYLSWAWAWGELLKRFPDATYKVYKDEQGCFYHTDGRTCWVETGVTVEGKEYIEMLPVMDFRNNSIPAEKITSVDVNKAIQRSLTKAVARHGLGLYIYAGEDLPDEERTTQEEKAAIIGSAKLGETDLKAVRNMLERLNKSEHGVCEYFKIAKLEDMTVKMMSDLNLMIQEAGKKKKEGK